MSDMPGPWSSRIRSRRFGSGARDFQESLRKALGLNRQGLADRERRSSESSCASAVFKGREITVSIAGKA